MFLRRFLLAFSFVLLGLGLNSGLVAMDQPSDSFTHSSDEITPSAESWDSDGIGDEVIITTEAYYGSGNESEFWDSDGTSSLKDSNDEFLMNEVNKKFGGLNSACNAKILQKTVSRNLVQVPASKNFLQIADAIVIGKCSLQTIEGCEQCLSDLTACVGMAGFELQDTDLKALSNIHAELVRVLNELEALGITQSERNMLLSVDHKVTTKKVVNLVATFNQIIKKLQSLVNLGKNQVCRASGLENLMIKFKRPVFINHSHITRPEHNEEAALGGGHFHCPNDQDFKFKSLAKNKSCELGYWTTSCKNRELTKISTLFSEQFEKMIFNLVLHDEYVDKSDLYKHISPECVYCYADEETGAMLYFKIIYDEKSECPLVKTTFPLFVHDKLVFSCSYEDFIMFEDDCRFHAFELDEENNIIAGDCIRVYGCGWFPRCSPTTKSISADYLTILPENRFDECTQKLYSQVFRSDRRLLILDFKTGKIDSEWCLMQLDPNDRTYMYVKIKCPKIMLSVAYEKYKGNKGILCKLFWFYKFFKAAFLSEEFLPAEKKRQHLLEKFIEQESKKFIEQEFKKFIEKESKKFIEKESKKFIEQESEKFIEQEFEKFIEQDSKRVIKLQNVLKKIIQTGLIVSNKND